MSNGFEQYLKEFTDSVVNSSVLTEGVEWSEITADGDPASVRATRNMYPGFVLNGVFYYRLDDRIFHVPVDKIKSGDLTYHEKPIASDKEDKPVEEGAWISDEMKHKFYKKTKGKILDAAYRMYQKLQNRGKIEGKSPIQVVAELANIDPRVLMIDFQERSIDESNKANKLNRPDRGQARALKPTDTLAVHRAIARQGYKVIDKHFISDGSVSFVRDERGDAYEVTVKPSYYASHFQKQRGLTEMIYDGSIGFHEVVDFHNSASPEQIAQLDQLIELGRDDEAWELINSVIDRQPEFAMAEDKSNIEQYSEIDGLEGPFRFSNGRVLYYDTAEGKYYDSDADLYVSNDELAKIVK